MALEFAKDLLGRLPLDRWLRPSGAPVVAVLMYHDLRADDDFANWLRVPVSGFEAQLEALSRWGGFVGPDALLETARLPRDRLSFLLTFDDGYRNNAELAAPILERRGIPALFFVSTGPMVSQAPFWTDMVVTPIQVLQLRELDLREVGFGVHGFRAGPEHARWDDIQRLLVAIKEVGNEDHPRVARLLRWLREEFATVLGDHLPRFRPLTAGEVERMAAGGCCHFGSHGHEHRILTRLDDEELGASLARSRDLLAGATGQRVEQLAYPNGDRDGRVVAAARASGFRRAYTVGPGLVLGRTRPLAIPRIAVADVDTPPRLRFKIQRELVRCRRRRGEGAFAWIGEADGDEREAGGSRASVSSPRS